MPTTRATMARFLVDEPLPADSVDPTANREDCLLEVNVGPAAGERFGLPEADAIATVHRAALRWA